jgi:hypothetical protein
LKQRYGGEIPGSVARKALSAITRNIVGFDIDALAILTAKTNYLIALAASDLLAYKGGEEIEIPIYMTNSVVTVEERKERALVVIEPTPVAVEVVRIPVAVEEVKEFLLPLKLVKSAELTAFLSDIGSLLDRNLPVDSSEVLEVLKKHTRICDSEDERRAWVKLLAEFYSNLLKLKGRGLDAIWVPIIKSYIVSTMFEGMFDYVVGNPPWIAYRYIMNPEYQRIVKSMIAGTYRLVLDGHLMTHMEMATLFFVRALDLYLRDGGLIGFVMPRAIFSADQHSNFRAGRVSKIKYKVNEIIDCKSVKPLFYVPTCAVIAVKGGETTYPVKAVIVSGKLPEDKHKILPLAEAKKLLKIEAGNLYLNSIGARTWLDYKQVSIRASRSYYYNHFGEGATIVPQACWFVDVVDVQQDFVVVQTSRRVEIRGKVSRRMPVLPVERKFIYGAFTSAEVLPFCHLPPNVTVLPIVPEGSRYRIMRKEEALRMGHTKLAQWLEKAERIWSEVRGEKEKKMTIYEQINFRQALSQQNPRAKYKVVYLRSGTNLAATVIDVEKVLRENMLLNGIIVESTLYRYETDNIDEAYYLVAVLNSSVLDQLIKPMQSKGEYGERDIHKKPLEFPIPKYNPDNEVHKRLAELGRKASEIAERVLPELLSSRGYDERLRERGALMPQEVATLRRDIRRRLGEVLKQIDDLVIELLKVKAVEAMGSATLDKYFKKT